MAVTITRRDYIWSYIGVFVSLGSSTLMMPFVLHYLSADMYGVWGVFQSIAAITTLFDFGFSTTFSRNVNYAWCGAIELKKTGAVYSETGAPNFVLMKRAMTACRYVFLILSGFAFLVMAIPGTMYVRYICRDIPTTEPLIAWFFYALATFINLYYGYYGSFLSGVGAITALNRVSLIARFVQIILSIALLASGLGIIGTGIAYLVSGLMVRILSKREFLNHQGIGKGLASVKDKITSAQIKETFLVVWHNASREGLVTLSNYLANQACTLISPLFMTLAETGVYALAVQLANVLSNVAATMYNANHPVLQSAYITNDKEKTRRTMSLIVFSYCGLTIVGLCALLTVGLPLIRLIKPETTPSIAIMTGVAAYQFILKFRNCYTSYFSCTNRIPYVKAFVISSILGVVLATALLALGLGIWGLIWAQIISQGCFNSWYWMLKAHKEMNLNLAQTVQYGWEELKKICIKKREAQT